MEIYLALDFADEGDIDSDAAEHVAADIYEHHGALLSKGLALSSPPTVHQALDGMLLYRWVFEN